MSFRSKFDKTVGKEVPLHGLTISGLTEFDSPETALSVIPFLSYGRLIQPSGELKSEMSSALAY